MLSLMPVCVDVCVCVLSPSSQLGARDRYISQLESVLSEHGLAHLVSRDALDTLDSELNAEEEEEERFTQKAVSSFEAEKVALPPPLPRGVPGACLLAAGYCVDGWVGAWASVMASVWVFLCVPARLPCMSFLCFLLICVHAFVVCVCVCVYDQRPPKPSQAC